MDDLTVLLADGPARSDGRDIDAATVTATSPLRVRFPGETAAVTVARTSGWTATVDAIVVTVRVGSGWVAIGQVQP